MSQSDKTDKNSSGFSILELLVSLSIIGIILTIVIRNQTFYSQGVALMSTVDDISLTFSEAQAYGVGVKEFAPGSADFSSPYGLSFSLLPAGSNSSYIIFADRNRNHTYDGDWSCPVGGLSECLEKKQITRGNIISKLCNASSSGSDMCTNESRFDITFVRPNPGAVITCYKSDGTLCSADPSRPGARIFLRSPAGDVRTVTVYNSGQISTQ